MSRPGDKPAPPGTSPWEAKTHEYDMLHVRLELVLQEVCARRPASMLELGCGVGILRGQISARAPDIAYYGCDISHSAVEKIGDPRVVCTDLNTQPLPFPDVRFDCVTGSGILEYLADVPRVLGEVRARLRAGGALVVTYFNMRHLYRRVQARFGRPPYRHPQWANDYSFGDLRRILAGAGFRIDDEIPTNLGFGRSPSIGRERWRHAALRRVRSLPGVQAFAHQLVFACTAR